MEDNHNTPGPALDDAVLLDLANELHRLAAGLKRELQRNAILPGLSDLSAMRPIQAMLTKALSARVRRTARLDSTEVGTTTTGPEMPGYL